MRGYLLLLLTSVCAGDDSYLGYQSYPGLQANHEHEHPWDQRRGEKGFGPWSNNNVYSVLQNRGAIENNWRGGGRIDNNWRREPGRFDNSFRGGPGRNENNWREVGRNENNWRELGRVDNNWQNPGRVEIDWRGSGGNRGNNNNNFRGPGNNDNAWRGPENSNWRGSETDDLNDTVDIREIRKEGQLREEEIGMELTRDGQEGEELLGRYGDRGDYQEGPPRLYQAPGRFGFGFEKRNLRASGLHNPITPEILQPIGYRTPLKELYFTPLNWRTL